MIPSEVTIKVESQDITAQVRGWITALDPEFWATATGIKLQIGARDTEGRIIGGALGEVRYGILQINYVDIAPSHCRSGLGTRVLSALESEGVKHGAVSALVTTLEFEAPIFYQKQGYVALGMFGAPVGSRKIVLSKEMSGNP